MPRYVIDKNDFLKGIAISEETGGFWRDQNGIDVYRTPGLLRPGVTSGSVYSEASATALTSPITRMVFADDSASPNSGIAYIVALSTNHGVRIRINAADSETAAVVAFSGNNAAAKEGAAFYKLGSASSSRPALFYSLDTDIGMYDTSLDFTVNANWDDNFMSSVPANASSIVSTTFRTMYHHKRQDVLYWNSGSSGNQVDKFDANTGVNGTLTENALDLPAGWEIRDFAQLRDYLAILAITPNLTTVATDRAFIQPKSKIFYWDGVADTWNYETPVIEDRLMGLFNNENGLFAYGVGDGISYYQLELEQANRLFNWPGTGNTIDLSAGVRDGNDVANYRAVATRGRQSFILGKDGNDAYIFAIGNRFGLPFGIHKPYLLKTAAGTVDLGDIVAVSPTKIYASYHDDNGASADQYRVVRFSSGNSSSTASTADTVELDSYFGGFGRMKKLKSIRFDFDKLASGDQIDLYKEVDYAGSWTRIDGGGSTAATNRIAYADLGAISTAHYNGADKFRHLRLRWNFVAGNAKIRRIVIEFDYND